MNLGCMDTDPDIPSYPLVVMRGTLGWVVTGEWNGGCAARGERRRFRRERVHFGRFAKGGVVMPAVGFTFCP